MTIHKKTTFSTNQKIILGLLIALIGLSIIVINFNSISKEMDTRNWNPTKAIIESIKTYRKQGKSGDNTVFYNYHVNIVYSYKVKSSVFRNSNYDLNGHFVTTNENKNKKYKNKIDNVSDITIFYNTSNPSESVINRGLSEGTWVKLTFSFFLLISGVFVTIVNYRNLSK